MGEITALAFQPQFPPREQTHGELTPKNILAQLQKERRLFLPITAFRRCQEDAIHLFPLSQATFLPTVANP